MDDEPELWSRPKSKLLDGIERWMRFAVYGLLGIMLSAVGLLVLFVTDWRAVINAPAADSKKVFGILGLLLGIAIIYVLLKVFVQVGIGELMKFARDKALRSNRWARTYVGSSAVLGGTIGLGISEELASPWVSALYAMLFAAVLGALAFSTTRQDRANPADDADTASEVTE